MGMAFSFLKGQGNQQLSFFSLCPVIILLPFTPNTNGCTKIQRDDVGVTLQKVGRSIAQQQTPNKQWAIPIRHVVLEAN